MLPQWFEMYLELEQATSVIHTYQAQFVPSLFQTEPYSRAVALLGHPRPKGADANLRVDLRMARQELLAKPDAPRVRAVVDEAALRRPIGGAGVMREQLRRLINLTELPNVTLQVMPFLAGGHAAAGGSFSILRFADPELPDVAYPEQLTSAVYLDKNADLDNYLMVMDRLRADAASPAETATLLADILSQS